MFSCFYVNLTPVYAAEMAAASLLEDRLRALHECLAADASQKGLCSGIITDIGQICNYESEEKDIGKNHKAAMKHTTDIVHCFAALSNFNKGDNLVNKHYQYIER